MFAVCARITLLIMAGVSAGCALHPKPQDAQSTQATAESVPVVRSGRYTLVELGPNDAQRDLMRQIVDIQLPSVTSITVGNALHIVLDQTGYRLCAAMDESHPLFGLPVPAVHRGLGPITLRDALEVLGGRGWQLEVDDLVREVCFSPRP